jgi:hypothetical protein
LGDYLILKYLKDRVFAELEPFFLDHGGKPLRKLFKTPYFAWTLPFIGAIIIISPLQQQ